MFRTIPKSSFDQFFKMSIIDWLSKRTEQDVEGLDIPNNYLVTYANKGDNDNIILGTLDGKEVKLDEVLRAKVGVIVLRMGNFEFEVSKGGGYQKYGSEINGTVRTAYAGFTYHTEIDLVMITSNGIGRNSGRVRLEMMKGLIKSILSSNDSIPILDWKANQEATDLKIRWKYGIDEITFTDLNMPSNEYQEGFFRIPVYCHVVQLRDDDILIDVDFQQWVNKKE